MQPSNLSMKEVLFEMRTNDHLKEIALIAGWVGGVGANMLEQMRAELETLSAFFRDLRQNEKDLAQNGRTHASRMRSAGIVEGVTSR